MSDHDLASLRGVVDALPPLSTVFDRIQRAFCDVAMQHGFEPVWCPVLERPNLFARAVGENTDIVNKEMYTFCDRSGLPVTLRPEFTATVVRMFLHSPQRQILPQRWFYVGPVFRYERPQKGRQRQFHQMGVEFLGASSLLSDVTTVVLAHDLLTMLGVGQQVSLHLNTLGSRDERRAYADVLRGYLIARADRLSEHARERIEKNPLRVLDSKHPDDVAVCVGAPSMSDSLGDESKRRFDRACALLIDRGIEVQRNDRLVRGLDYYNDLVFEFRSDALGAQNAVIAGGRYDGLADAVGGVSVPCIGWAAGIERLALLVCDAMGDEARRVDVAVVAVDTDDPADCQAVLLIAERLRQKGLTVLTGVDVALKKSLRDADRRDVTSCVVIGETERVEGVVVVRDMMNGKEQRIAVDALLEDPMTWLLHHTTRAQ